MQHPSHTSRFQYHHLRIHNMCIYFSVDKVCPMGTRRVLNSCQDEVCVDGVYKVVPACNKKCEEVILCHNTNICTICMLAYVHFVIYNFSNDFLGVCVGGKHISRSMHLNCAVKLIYLNLGEVKL